MHKLGVNSNSLFAFEYFEAFQAFIAVGSIMNPFVFEKYVEVFELFVA